ncbi:S8 family serine peptidase [Pseudotenacibaculum haliotis]|uniref:S8 family serine peptidase n=1 Tax=Pseudotenacibaculum haliotis TaxID=1862138 RepID=A0ABW5LWJ7_9FLAO
MKKQLLLVGLSLFVLTTKISAQNDDDRKLIIKQTNVEALNQIVKESKEKYDYFLAKAKESGSLKFTTKNKEGHIGYLAGFYKDGTPYYDFESNIDAAIASRVNKIWQGGSSGLNLDGSNIVIGHWEVTGSPLTTHQDLSPKIVLVENPVTSHHATHTAGTMVGSGLDANARGIASNARIESYSSNNDIVELAGFGTLGGILSNNSYSRGAPDGTTHGYGRYDENARSFDQITHDAPFLTICKSAGNTRNQGVNLDDNGYDTIFTIATAKNIIVVGAVEDIAVYSGPSSVVQSSFSSWGPTDDWRIKPDIVANGVEVYSTSNGSNSNYVVSSGTSMSTPVVTGSIALLQQHYHNLNNIYMKSATVKALLLNTTDEAGEHDGPDFQNGWGLLNAERAAEVISNNGTGSKIEELTLNNNETYTTQISVDGTGNLELTIAWTDPEGAPFFGPEDSPSSLLINDLDVRLIGSSETYAPWVIVPNATFDNFSVPASKGDNSRDNVERIDVKNIPAGNYTISITHKNSLVNGSQDFSLVVNGVTDTALGVNNIDLNSFLKVYPNPSTSGIFQIELLQSENLGTKTATLYDLQGRLIKEKEFDNNLTEINTSGLSSGNYLLVLKSKKRIYKKLIIVSN